MGEDDTLILDFTKNVNLGGPTEAEYVVIMFRSMAETGDNFAEWYEKNSVSITGKFNNGDYVAYIIDDACDIADSGTTYGGLVFFNRSVENAVLLAEVEPEVTPAPAVPEPAGTGRAGGTPPPPLNHRRAILKQRAQKYSLLFFSLSARMGISGKAHLFSFHLKSSVEFFLRA